MPAASSLPSAMAHSSRLFALAKRLAPFFPLRVPVVRESSTNKAYRLQRELDDRCPNVLEISFRKLPLWMLSDKLVEVLPGMLVSFPARVFYGDAVHWLPVGHVLRPFKTSAYNYLRINWSSS